MQLSRRPFIGEVANDFSWRIVAIGYHVGSSNRAISHSAGQWSSSQLIAANFLCYDMTDDFRCPPPNGVRWVERRRDLRSRRAQHTGRLGGHFLAVLQRSDTPYRRCLQPVPRQMVGCRDSIIDGMHLNDVPGECPRKCSRSRKLVGASGHDPAANDDWVNLLSRYASVPASDFGLCSDRADALIAITQTTHLATKRTDAPITSPCRQGATPSALFQQTRIVPERHCCAERQHEYRGSVAPTDFCCKSHSYPPCETPDRQSGQLRASRGRQRDALELWGGLGLKNHFLSPPIR